MKDNKSILDDERIGRLLLKLSVPAFIGILVTTTYNIVNTIFIGRFVGTLAIAGISMVFPIQMVTMGIGQLFGAGGASVISRAIGAGNRDRAERALGNAITAIIVLSLIILILGMSHIDFWLRLIGASEDILPYARDYLTIILFGLFFQTLAMSLSNLIISEGNARISMTGMAIGAISNILFDAIFIIVFKMGVKGAATGTIIAQFLCLLFYMNFYFRGKSFLKIHTKNLVFKWDVLKGILAIGISPFITTSATSLSILFINRGLITYGGDIAVSAYGIINRLMMFTVMPGMSIGQGVQPIIGFNYGSKRYDRVLRTMKIALTAASTIGVIVFSIIYFAPEFFISIFTTDDALITMSTYVARHIFLAMYFSSFIIVCVFTFQSIGKAVKSFIIMLRPFIFLLPLVLVLPKFFQLNGVLFAYPLTETFAFIVALILLVPQVKQFRRMGISVKTEVINAEATTV